jgi:hypothetical protein
MGLAAAAGLALSSLQAAPTLAADKKVVHSQDDLPRFSYPIAGTATALVTSDDATFNAFAAKVGADVDCVLEGYDIQDPGLHGPASCAAVRRPWARLRP